MSPVCITCGYWVASVGDQCDSCHHTHPEGDDK